MEKVLRQHGFDTPVVSVVKDEYHRPKQILGDKKWLSYEREILLGNAESHRFAISFHKKLRNKALLKTLNSENLSEL
jgi:excinuclease UvrABC nuclease subunit